MFYEQVKWWWWWRRRWRHITNDGDVRCPLPTIIRNRGHRNSELLTTLSR